MRGLHPRLQQLERTNKIWIQISMTTVTSLFLLDPVISIYLIQAFSPLQRSANMMIGMLRVLNLFAWFSSWLIGPEADICYLHCKMWDIINAVQLSLHGSLPRAKSFFIWRVKRYLQRSGGKSLEEETGTRKKHFPSPRSRCFKKDTVPPVREMPFGGGE